ncbi:MAG TPA: nuclear transport factor 2 family protein [Chitinophagaceae bacterium]|nr:nuclear transport factor 2 family protein [Chitinophagaceae bacterium]
MISVQSTTVQEVWDVLLNIDKALVEKNAVELERLISPDFIGAAPTGQSFTKEAYIQHHCKPGFGIMALTEEGIDATAIRFYGNTAVVNRRAHSQFKLPAGNLVEYDVQRLEVLLKANNEWQLVSGQGTQVMQLARPN